MAQRGGSLKYIVGIVVVVIVAVAGIWLYTSRPVAPPPTDVTTLIHAFTADPSSLDPAVVFDDSLVEMGPMYETLTRFTPEGEPLPHLAESWNSSTDAMTWTFRLKDGVKFHDGTELNASAVKFSFERVLAINKGGAYMLYGVDSMDVVDRLTIRFLMKYPSRLDLIIGGAYTTYIVSPTYVLAHATTDDSWAEEWMKDHECGTGPYKLVEWTHGQQVVCEKFADYWGGWAGKHVDTVIIRIVREATTHELQLKQGVIDSTWSIPAEKLSDFQNNPNFTVKISPTYHTYYWRINTQKPPTNDVRVRKAISYAFPYQVAVDQIFKGYAEQLQGPVAKGIWGHDDNLFMYQLDLDMARQLLTDAGYPNGGFTLTLYYYTGSESQRMMAELFRSNLAQLGITLDARAYPFSELEQLCNPFSVTPSEAPHMSAHDWWPSWAADPYDYLYGMFYRDQYFNWSFYNNTEFERIIDEANAVSVTNRTRSVELYRQAQLMLVEEAATIYLVQVKNTFVSRSWVYGYDYNPNYQAVVPYYSIYKELP